MSPSTSASENVPRVTLRVYTQSLDAEVFLVDDRLQLVARGIGSLETEQPPGVYKVKVQQARDLQHKTILLTQDQTIHWDPPTVESAAPLADTSRTHEYQTYGVRDASRHVDRKHGEGGQLFVVSRNWSAKDESNVRPRAEHPGAGVSLAAWNGEWTLDLADLDVHDHTRDAWCSVNIETDPGAYLLRATVAGAAVLEQPVIVSPGWQTLVFLLSRPVHRSDSEPTLNTPLESAAEVLNASVLMSKNGFSPDDWQFRTTEIARLALADDRPIRSSQLDDILAHKFDNPMLGIFGAHLLLQSREELQAQHREQNRRARLQQTEASRLQREQRDFNQELFDTIVRNLRSLVGHDHPDVEALSLQASPPLRRTDPLNEPPMLRRSWSELVAASQTHASLVPADVWLRTAMRVPSTPFLSWLQMRADDDARREYMEALRGQLKPRRRSNRPRFELESAAEVTAAPPDLDKISIDLEIPRAAVEWLQKP
jgi:hypothetical protein